MQEKKVSDSQFCIECGIKYYGNVEPGVYPFCESCQAFHYYTMMKSGYFMLAFLGMIGDTGDSGKLIYQDFTKSEWSEVKAVYDRKYLEFYHYPRDTDYTKAE